MIPTRRPLREQLLDLVREHMPAARAASLRELDGRALADIGVDASEIASIEAEAQGRARRTRLRLVSA